MITKSLYASYAQTLTDMASAAIADAEEVSRTMAVTYDPRVIGARTRLQMQIGAVSLGISSVLASTDAVTFDMLAELSAEYVLLKKMTDANKEVSRG